MEFPEIPADLTGLSNEDLSALATSATEARDAALAGGDDVDLDAFAAMAAGYERVLAEQSNRAEAVEPDDRAEQLAAIAARIAPPAMTDPPSPEAEPASAGASTGGATVLRATPNQVVMADGTVFRRDDGSVTASAEPLAPGADDDERARHALRSRAARLPPLTNSRSTAEPVRPEAEPIVAGAALPVAQGSHLVDMRSVATMVKSRRENFGYIEPGLNEGERVVVASIMSELPENRRLRREEDAFNWRKVADVTSLDAITAAGGLCAPVTPYYRIMTLAGAFRPVRDALVTFTADRGGIRFNAPLQISDAGPSARTVTDGVTNTTTTVTSATAAFDSRDVGASISGTGIPAGAFIVAVTNATTVTISAAATATASSVTLTITRKGVSVVITVAQDAAAGGGATAANVVAATKPCLEVTCPGITENVVQAITRCLKFANFTTRADPEQVEAWLTLAVAQQARTAETALLDALSANSTQMTGAQLGTSPYVGAARQIVGQTVKAAAYYRNRNRMSPDAPLRTLRPAWEVDLATADLALSSGSELEFFSMARQLAQEMYRQANVIPTFYVDSGTGKGQLINSGNKVTAGAMPVWPTTSVSYLFAEGTHLLLDGGQMDFGLIRDSVLNQANRYLLFAETFEGLATVGPESLEITTTLQASGGASALVAGPVSW